jgi:hypothetical protein
MKTYYFDFRLSGCRVVRKHFKADNAERALATACGWFFSVYRESEFVSVAWIGTANNY